jgi:DNA-3-methyladenine glycosylase II
VSPASAPLRVEVRPRSPFTLPVRSGLDGLTRVRGGVLHRLVHVNGEPVLVRVGQPARERVVFVAQGGDGAGAEEAVERMRRALGVDCDLSSFYERFRFDPLIGRSVRALPGLRPPGRPEPFEALAWAICEQLIEFERAAAIQRRIVARLGRRCAFTMLRDAPAAEVVAAQAPARLASWGLSEGRAVALVRVAVEVARGRVDLGDPDHERGWRRLRAIRGIGSWTVQMLALTGQGRLDQLPAADVAFLRFVGRLKTGDPYARATEEEVEEFFSPYEPWAGLAGLHALRVAPSAQGARLGR